jgi:hypothetical protein
MAAYIVVGPTETAVSITARPSSINSLSKYIHLRSGLISRRYSTKIYNNDTVQKPNNVTPHIPSAESFTIYISHCLHVGFNASKTTQKSLNPFPVLNFQLHLYQLQIHWRACARVCVCVCARARARACVCVCGGGCWYGRIQNCHLLFLCANCFNIWQGM